MDKCIPSNHDEDCGGKAIRGFAKKRSSSFGSGAERSLLDKVSF